MLIRKNKLLKQFGTFSFASVLSLLVFSLYSIVDGLIVARGIGEAAMSAVNLCTPFLSLLYSIAVFFAVGTSTIIAKWKGEGENNRAGSLFTMNLVVLAIIGAAITVIVLVFKGQIAVMLGANEETFGLVRDYLAGVGPFSAFFILSYAMEVLVKTDGHPRLAACCVLIGCVSNGILDYLFVYVFHSGIFGPAFATGFVNVIMTAVYVVHFAGKKKNTFRFSRFRFDFSIYKRLLPLGIADGASELCTGLMVFIFNHIVLKYLGQEGLVCYSIVSYVTYFVMNMMIGISQGPQPLISFNMGRKNMKNVNSLFRYGLFTAAAIGVCAFVIVLFFAPNIAMLFTSEGNYAAVSAVYMKQYALGFAFLGLNLVISGFFTAVELPVYASVISIGRGLVVQSIILVGVAAATAGKGIWFVPLISEGICLALSVLFTVREAKKKRVLPE